MPWRFDNVLIDSVPKFGQLGTVVIVFFAVLAAVFFVASRVPVRFQRSTSLLVLLGPAIALLAIGLIIPAFRTIVLSFLNSDSTKWLGFKNYVWAFTDSDNQTVLINTVIWIVVAPLASTVLGLVLALLLDKMKRESIAKSLIFLPMAISFVGASIIWKFVYESRTGDVAQVGILSEVVTLFGVHNPPNWMLLIPWNNLLLMVIMIWVQTGFAMVVLSAAIKAIPADITEAAALDGATGWGQFTRITIPMIRGTLVVVLTTIMIAVLKIFDIVRTMTGGNFKTSVLANEMYSQTFVQFNTGRGAALAVILFVGVIPLVIYNISVLRRERSER